MLADMTGLQLLLTIAVIAIVLIGAIAGLITWLVLRASKSRKAALQHAYEAGFQNGQQRL